MSKVIVAIIYLIICIIVWFKLPILYAGVGLGVGVVALVIVVILACLYARTKRQRDEAVDTIEEYENVAQRSRRGSHTHSHHHKTINPVFARQIPYNYNEFNRSEYNYENPMDVDQCSIPSYKAPSSDNATGTWSFSEPSGNTQTTSVPESSLSHSSNRLSSSSKALSTLPPVPVAINTEQSIKKPDQEPNPYYSEPASVFGKVAPSETGGAEHQTEEQFGSAD